MKKTFLIIFNLLILLIILFYYNNYSIYVNTNFNNVTKISHSKNIFSNNYASNNYFVFNNNVAQYSVYIIVGQKKFDQIYRIESFVQFNFKYIKKFDDIKGFKCLLKHVHPDETEEVIELYVHGSPGYYFNTNKKLIFQFKASDFSSIRNNTSKFCLNNIVIAVIRSADYDRKLDLGGFYDNLYSYNFTQSIVLPYSLISYQVPEILYKYNPILHSVGICVHYTYVIPNVLKNWIDYHLSFAFENIMMYDATQNQKLKKFISETYKNDSRLIVRPFRINHDDLCKSKKWPKQVSQFLKQSCQDFYHSEFKEMYNGRYKHEQLSSNDCFTVLSQKHEFVAYYDLDEFVFPRTLDILKDFYEPKKYFSSDTISQICSLNPFQNIFKTQNANKSNYFYNYLYSLIDKYRDGRNVDKLASISFQHVAYLVPNFIEKQLFHDLGQILKRIDEYYKTTNITINNSTNTTSIFPIKLYLSEPPYNRGHSFVIEEKDVDYVRYLHKAYYSFVPSIYHEFINKIPNINDSFLRHVYFITENDQRWPKAIHFHKNVNSLFIHYAISVASGSWSFSPSPYNGHFLPHFRNDVNDMYKGNFTGSIRKLNIDLEYMFYLLKHYTGFCKI